jgi:hypothetical protein
LTVRGPAAAASWNVRGACDFFREVAYANYIQESIGPTSKHQPKAAHWLRAREPFRELLNDLKPGKVLILGCFVWRDIIADWQVPKTEYETFSLPVKNGPEARICVIPHPSSWNRLRPPCTPEKAHAHFCDKFGG